MKMIEAIKPEIGSKEEETAIINSIGNAVTYYVTRDKNKQVKKGIVITAAVIITLIITDKLWKRKKRKNQ